MNLWSLLGELSNVFWLALKWGLLGLAATLGLYFFAKGRGAFRLHMTGERWVRRLIALLWIVLLPLGSVGVGILFAAQEAAIQTVSSETDQAARQIALVYVEPATSAILREVGPSGRSREDEPLRISMSAVQQAKAQILDEIRSERDRLIAKLENDDSLQSDFQIWAVSRAYAHVLDRSADEQLEAVNEFLSVLDEQKAADGTVGVDDLAAVISAEYLEPEVKRYVGKTFASMRIYLYLILALVIALPILLCHLIDRRMRRSRAEPALAAAEEE